jgi:predicted nucleic acid-binding protein
MLVIDASLVVALAIQDARAAVVQVLLRKWIGAGEKLHAPELLPYEVANGLTRAVVAGTLAVSRLPAAWRAAEDLPVTYHSLGTAGETVVGIARQLQRQNAYDAAYLALAQDLGAEVWTFDKKLARNAGLLGYAVRLVEAEAA